MSDSIDRRMAPYSMRSAESRGRVHDEPPDPVRNAFGLDRHRVVCSAAFRRLEYKTQVFMTYEDDHFRTRLTHTLEVAETSRRLAIALGVNPTLAEVIALAHDLGHPPFGHAGEIALRALMRDHGGFEHNRQSLRIVEYLEHPYPRFRGLNLTFEVREGLAKHETIYDQQPSAEVSDGLPADLQSLEQQPTLEAQVACVADRLAYDCHDLEDAIAAGLIAEPDLTSVRLWAESVGPVRACHPDLPLPAIRRPVLDNLLNALLLDVIAESQRRIDECRPTTVDDIRRQRQALVDFSPDASAMLAELEQ